MNSVTRWFGPLSGLLAVVLVVLGQGAAGSIDSEPSDSAGTMLSELRERADDARLGVVFGVFALGLLLVYVGHLRARFDEEGAGWAGGVFSMGGVALAAALVVYSGVELTGAEAGEQGHEEVARLVVDFNWNGAWLFSPGLLAAGIGIAVASFANRALPGWLGGFGVLVAVSAIMPWIGLPLFVLWVLAASITELVAVVRERRPQSAQGLS